MPIQSHDKPSKNGSKDENGSSLVNAKLNFKRSPEDYSLSDPRSLKSRLLSLVGSRGSILKTPDGASLTITNDSDKGEFSIRIEAQNSKLKKPSEPNTSIIDLNRDGSFKSIRAFIERIPGCEAEYQFSNPIAGAQSMFNRYVSGNLNKSNVTDLSDDLRAILKLPYVNKGNQVNGSHTDNVSSDKHGNVTITSTYEKEQDVVGMNVPIGKSTIKITVQKDGRLVQCLILKQSYLPFGEMSEVKKDISFARQVLQQMISVSKQTSAK